MPNWYEWREDTFKKAQKEKKPIFLSIVFEPCEKCRRMREEVFEDKELSNVLDKNFIPVKVDRDERPDIALYFQKVYKLLNRKKAEWPLSIFLTHEKKPFFAGSYIPPSRREMIIGFDEVTEIISQKYLENPKELIEQAELIAKAVEKIEFNTKAAKLDEAFLKKALENAGPILDIKKPGRTQNQFLEDYAYRAYLLLKEYESTKKQTCLINAQKLCNDALAKFYKNGLWFFSHGEFELFAQPQDTGYPSSSAVMTDVLISLGTLVEKKYLAFAFKTLEYNSIDIMKRPEECGTFVKAALRYLLLKQ